MSQSAGITGWTNGNMLGTAIDMARFFWDLLSPASPEPLVSEAAKQEMTRFKMMTAGWGAGLMAYGAGLMPGLAT